MSGMSEQETLQISLLMEALKECVVHIERTTCLHEETHRGGVLWEICDACGAKWADDEGGKPEHVTPKALDMAYSVIEKFKSAPLADELVKFGYNGRYAMVTQEAYELFMAREKARDNAMRHGLADIFAQITALQAKLP